MLDEIRLDSARLKRLRHCAEVAGARLIATYEGEFRPAPGSPHCVGLHCSSPGQLVHFGALVAFDFGLPDPLLLVMARRTWEDCPGDDAGRIYYWPGVLAPAREPLTAAQLREADQLARHLVAVHKNAAAQVNDLETNRELHNHEHHGPGGLRNHSYEDLSYDEADLGEVLAEEDAPEEFRTPWQVARDNAEQTGVWPKDWGPYHRHFASDAIHRDGGEECDQPGTPRRVYMFDPDALDAHERAVARYAIEHPGQFTGGGQ